MFSFLDVANIESALPTGEPGSFSVLFRGIADGIIKYGLRIVLAAAVLIVGFKLSSRISKRISSKRGSTKLSPDAQNFVRGALNFALKALIVLLAVAIMGIPLSSVVALISSIAVGIGLALQGSLSNIAGGVVLFIFKPFRVGDIIEADSYTGAVESIGIFFTTITTFDNRRAVIPNSTISNSSLLNYSSYDIRRVDISVGASYSSDAEKVKTVLMSVVEAHSLVLHEPAPFVRLQEYKDSAMTYSVRAWCKTEDYWTVYHDLQEGFQSAFENSGISFPYPQLDVHMDT